MQKLRKSWITNTPTVITHDRSNCGLSLNSPEGRGSVTDLKTFLNNPDASLTARGHAGQNLRVSVIYPHTKTFGVRVYVLNKIRTLHGTKIHSSAKHTKLTLLENAKTLLTERRPALLPISQR